MWTVQCLDWNLDGLRVVPGAKNRLPCCGSLIGFDCTCPDGSPATAGILSQIAHRFSGSVYCLGLVDLNAKVFLNLWVKKHLNLPVHLPHASHQNLGIVVADYTEITALHVAANMLQDR